MVLLVVDTQKGIVDERLYAFEKFVSNIRKLIRTAREQGIEVVYVQHDDGPGTGFSIGDDEFEVYSEFAPLPTERRFVKTVCSAFKKESGLLEYLTEKGEKDVMVCGIKIVDGHAPLLSAKDLNAYIAAGVQSDHECSNIEEAMEKLRRGQYIMIREGTAAKNKGKAMEKIKRTNK